MVSMCVCVCVYICMSYVLDILLRNISGKGDSYLLIAYLVPGTSLSYLHSQYPVRLVDYIHI